ncbi:MAG: hypothetical protein ACKVQA_23425 [Burkholderiales bacterium]
MWRKRLRVRISPFEVSIAAGEAIERFAVEESQDLSQWRHAVAVLSGQLVLPRFAGRISLEVELSNHFVRYLVIPQRRELRGRAELMAFVRHRFVHTYGPSAQDWALCLSGDGPARLAAAADSGLVLALQALCKKSGKLRCVIPSFSAGFDRTRFGASEERYWYVQAERARVCIGCVELGRWALVHGQSLITGDAEELGGIFQQLAMTSAGWIPEMPVYTQGIDAATLGELAAQGWRVRESAPAKAAASTIPSSIRSVESRS